MFVLFVSVGLGDVMLLRRHCAPSLVWYIVHAWLRALYASDPALMLSCALLLGCGAHDAQPVLCTWLSTLAGAICGDVLLCVPSHTSQPGRASREQCSSHQGETPSQLLPPTPPPPQLEASCRLSPVGPQHTSCRSANNSRQACTGTSTHLDSMHGSLQQGKGKGAHCVFILLTESVSHPWMACREFQHCQHCLTQHMLPL